MINANKIVLDKAIMFKTCNISNNNFVQLYFAMVYKKLNF